jgi:hypothetical protein
LPFPSGGLIIIERNGGTAMAWLSVVGHELHFAEPEIDAGLDDGLRVGAGDPVEAVRDDPELYAVEYRIDFGGLQHAS